MCTVTMDKKYYGETTQQMAGEMAGCWPLSPYSPRVPSQQHYGTRVSDKQYVGYKDAHWPPCPYSHTVTLPTVTDLEY